ncbi:CHC2 zinc finger domain-containing protein [Geopsychrobacter electrodiphilus]|uniref:CHC2 zinc finger domain-containing protein n=1 Tax=Geopsychrobacter electrodiphilus TaxID=225196 RepID=UPI00036489F5|nr:CHC2 zinc finger domain-containing protein [Geopsychrobacter electrodiphilus]
MSDFATIKEALNLQKVIENATSQVMGKTHLPECPFCGGHDCFSIPKDKDYFKCFQCEEKGDVFNFLEKYHQTDSAEALKIGAELAGIPLEQKKKSSPKLSVTDKIRLEAAEYYHAHMLKNGGRTYLIDERGHALKTLEKERVGFSDGHLVDHLLSKEFSEREILESGLGRERELEGGRRVVYDFFSKDLVVFPHFSAGKVLHFTQKDPTKKLKYQLTAKQRDKRWAFYGQDAIDKYDEILLVEGENDRLQVINTGVGYVMAMIGQISDDQIKVLKKLCGSKKLYLWVDNDKAGRDYVRKICGGLRGQNVRIVVYGKDGDDPDSYLKGFEGDRRKEIRRLQLEAVGYINWELQQSAGLSSLEEKLLHLKEQKIFQRIGQEQAVQQDIYREKLSVLGFSAAAIEQQLDFSQDLLQQIRQQCEMVENPKDIDPIAMAETIFRFFAHHGRFYYDADNTVWLIYQNETYEVHNNTKFNALMLKMTRMIISQAPGGQVWDALRHTAYLNGRRIDRCRWIHTDSVKDTIYLNLNGPNNTILKVSLQHIEEIQNGMNDDHVLLSSSPKISPMNWLPDVDVQEGMTALKELVFDNLAIKHEQRYLVLCWLISGLCPDLAPYQFLMKFGGYASSGKSTAAKLISTVFFGNDELSDPSGAAAFSNAAQNPLLVIDNLENKDLNRGMQKFLLLAATRGQKEKRKGGTDTGTVDESPRALICVTAIEPFTLSELITRTFEIPFDRRVHGDDSFFESEVLENLKKKRDLIMSAMIRFIQTEILTNLDQRKQYMAILNTMFKGHSKDRSNAYLALLMLINSRMLKYIPFYEPDDLMYGYESREKEIYEAWIEEQNNTARETETGSNNILQLLGGLVREYIQANKHKNETEAVADYSEPVFTLDHKDYGLRMFKTMAREHQDDNGEKYFISTIEFVASSADVVDAFDMLAKNTGKNNPYGTAAIFTARLRNDRSVLSKSGWELIETPGKEPYFKVLHGNRFFKFRHVLVK